MKVFVTDDTDDTDDTENIGSQTYFQMLQADIKLIIVGNLCSSKLTIFDRIETLTRNYLSSYSEDLREPRLLEKVTTLSRIATLIYRGTSLRLASPVLTAAIKTHKAINKKFRYQALA